MSTAVHALFADANRARRPADAARARGAVKLAAAGAKDKENAGGADAGLVLLVLGAGRGELDGAARARRVRGPARAVRVREERVHGGGGRHWRDGEPEWRGERGPTVGLVSVNR